MLFRAVHRYLASLDRGRKIVFLRIALHVSSILLMLPGVLGHSVTVVEFVQLPAGLAAWQRNSLGIYNVCGPVSKLIYALPAYLTGIQVDYPESYDVDVGYRQEWSLGEFFQAQHRDTFHRIYQRTRWLPMLFMVLSGCLICEWATRIFGDWAGVISLCTWSWMPPILAHGSLVTSDILAAFGLLMAARTFWAFLVKPALWTALLSGLALGVAQATKFSLIVLYPCWLMLLIGRAFCIQLGMDDGTRCFRNSKLGVIALGLLSLSLSVLAIDACYGFQKIGHPLSILNSGKSSISQMIRSINDIKYFSIITHIPVSIPLQYMRGLDVQLADTERIQSAYLFGRIRLGGWWYWYLFAFIIKVPLPIVVLLGITLSKFSKILISDTLMWANICMIFPALAVASSIAASTGTGTNAAFRYLVPSLALLCVYIGSVHHATSRMRNSVVCAMLCWLLANAITSVPDHLGWQNEAGWIAKYCTGKPALIGDSLDWGQDISRLSQWISAQSPANRTIVCAYGLGRGETYGLSMPRAQPASDNWDDGHFLAVSENILFGYSPDTSIQIAGRTSRLSREQCDALLRLRPSYRVGRSIKIYNLNHILSVLGRRGIGAIPK